MRYLLILSLFLTQLNGKADRIPLDIGKVILHSDLIVYATSRSEQKHTFKLEVQDIWFGKDYGIKKGDYLKIPKDIEFGCGFSTDAVAEVGTAILFLKKEKGNWRLTRKYFIPGFINNLASINIFECYYTANQTQWKNNIQAFLKEFHLDQSGYIQASKSEEVVLNSPSLLPLVYEYYRNFYPNLRFQIKSKLDCGYIHKPQLKTGLITEKDTFIHVITEEMALPPEPFDSLFPRIIDSLEKKHPELIELGIRGTMFYSLLIEKDGSISRVETLRSLHPNLDKDAREYLMNLPPWTPAKQRGKPVRLRFNIPLKFNYQK